MKPSQRVFALRRLALGALGLLCIIGALQARMGALSADPQPELRQRRIAAVEQATTLLVANPGVDGLAQSATAQSANPGTTGAPVPGPQILPMQDAGRGTTASTPAALGAAQAGGTAAPQDSSGRQMDGIGAIADAPRRIVNVPVKPRHALIPEKIESSAAQESDSDPLAAAIITGGLRVLDGNDTPLRLVDIRTDGPVASVRLHLQGTAPRAGEGDPWFRQGEIAFTGWIVVAISRTDALVLSPMGNLFRLHPVPGKTLAANRLPTAASVQRQPPEPAGLR